jgi:crotonobetainyl-CoA:carnitine CoA-transferase CaiB-like acyl-CoA transferase
VTAATLTSVLAGLKVVDFSHAAAGPYCSELLAELGAEVLKIESPAGDHFRDAQGGAVYANVNRNKRCITLDLKSTKGLEIAKRLVADADILVESYIPGTMAGLGLGFEDAHEINRRLVYVSISGFGQTGPYRRRPGYDVVAQAMSGLMAATGEADRPPVRVGASLLDYGTGLFAAFGTLAALREREKDGRGRQVDANLLETGIGWMNYWFTYYGFTGEVPVRQGSGLTLFAPYQVFNTCDGELFIGVSTDRFFTDFCKLFGLEALLANPNYSSNAARCANRKELVQAVQSRLDGMRKVDCIALLEKAAIPHAPVLDVSDVAADDHVRARKILGELAGNDGRPQLIPRLPLTVSGLPHREPTPAPRRHQHTAEVLRELGYAAEEVHALIRSGVVQDESSHTDQNHEGDKK